MYTVFIDGSEGTTGLKINDRFQCRDDITLLKIDPAKRKDINERARLIEQADVAFLCLPDVASKEIMQKVGNCNTLILDTSTAHRTDSNWAYGFPELSDWHHTRIVNHNRVAVPGCHASGFISAIYPLVASKILSKDARTSCTSITGYSGGGKGMIADYTAETRARALNAPRQYGLTQNHKHLKEMSGICGLYNAPLFTPIVCDYYCGMQVMVQFTSSEVGGRSADEIRSFFSTYYADKKMIHVLTAEECANASMIASNEYAEKDDLALYVFGNDDRIIITTLYDNLGKGASGAAVQCMNIMLGCPETTGLNLK
ncbi:MAG: N-acetyl-gamma-glutamyl-phosphate reductase [Bacillota bacterium]